ncbi:MULTISPECIES: replication initiator protein A [unclassified Fusobacterium]|uniref:replication initiator protein A n=1 Tax=unclassified Fusobacterium TaxID=2648384 RepID=UPI001B8B20E2|nr:MULTISPECIES: replication initiator protein A [unclassified Fusobacterium]MBR8702082.1 hypothetical protein [Fusobacterium sp. DD45]MBR8711884.1 hypothetical protein [Fusobacterium sp. DD28]MBR8752463.1 hypothetical protein [Fusobacterium sp. DD26]
MEYITLADVDAKGYYPLPKNLFNNKNYQIKIKTKKKIKDEVKTIVTIKDKLNDTSKILYSILCDKLSDSVSNGWWDQDKRVYVKFSVSKLCQILNKSRDTVIKCKKELEESNLLKIVPGGLGKSDIFYLGKIKPRPSEDMELEYLDKTDTIFFNKPVDNIDQSKVTLQTSRKHPCKPVDNVDSNNYYNNYITTTSSSGEKFSFLNIKKYPLLDLGTINNIKKYKPDIQEKYFDNIYKAIECDFKSGKIKNFCGALFTAIKNNWALTPPEENKTQLDPKAARKKIRERCNYWVDFYCISKDKDDSLNRYRIDTEIYKDTYPELVQEYEIKLEKALSKGV